MLPAPYLSASGFKGHGALNRKENSFPDHRRRTRGGSRYRVPAQARQSRGGCPTPVGNQSTGYGILTVFPFATNSQPATGQLPRSASHSRAYTRGAAAAADRDREQQRARIISIAGPEDPSKTAATRRSRISSSSSIDTAHTALVPSFRRLAFCRRL